MIKEIVVDLDSVIREDSLAMKDRPDKVIADD